MKIEFAPLQGYTDATFRNAHEKYFGGIDTYYTPFVRLEKGNNFRPRELRDIDPINNTVNHLVPQLIANSPEEFRILTDRIQADGYTEIDINMGCPFPLITRKQKGAGILSHPELVGSLLQTIHEYPSLSFSVKLRLGMESAKELIQLIPILNQTPLTQIVVHTRLGKQQYKGETDREHFGQFLQLCTHPVVYNGDIKTSEDIAEIQNSYPNISGVMIGRGLLANPALALEYRSQAPLPMSDKRKRLQSMHAYLLETACNRLQGDAHILAKMKPWWDYLLPELEKKLRKHILKSNKLSAYQNAVQEAWNSLQCFQE